MSKQDRQGARTPAELERKYEFGQTLSQLEEATQKQSDLISRQGNTMDDFIASSNSTIASMEKDISNVEKSVTSLKQGVNSLQIRMTNAERRDKELSQSISGLAQRISNSEQSHSATTAELAASLKAVEETLADLIERVTALEST